MKITRNQVENAILRGLHGTEEKAMDIGVKLELTMEKYDDFIKHGFEPEEATISSLYLLSDEAINIIYKDLGIRKIKERPDWF